MRNKVVAFFYSKIGLLLIAGAITVILLLTPSPAACLNPKETEENLVKGNNLFALDLYAKLCEATPDKNIFFSPYSISTALAMTYAGARGRTEQQMAEVLHFELPPQQLHSAFSCLIHDLSAEGKKYQLSIANALWAQQGYRFLDEFLEIQSKEYGAGLQQLDFIHATEHARLAINQWVEEKTNQKIQELLKPGILKSITRLVITNAIYFKGSWASQFDPKMTEDAPFTTLSGEKVTIRENHRGSILFLGRILNPKE